MGRKLVSVCYRARLAKIELRGARASRHAVVNSSLVISSVVRSKLDDPKSSARPQEADGGGDASVGCERSNPVRPIGQSWTGGLKRWPKPGFITPAERRCLVVVCSTRLTACLGICVLRASACGLPIRPVLKHGPRSLTCVRVSGRQNGSVTSGKGLALRAGLEDPSSEPVDCWRTARAANAARAARRVSAGADWEQLSREFLGRRTANSELSADKGNPTV
ncbi:hypothetical protein Bca4012_103427 [Brassica carinata]